MRIEVLSATVDRFDDVIVVLRLRDPDALTATARSSDVDNHAVATLRPGPPRQQIMIYGTSHRRRAKRSRR
jgi:hypothetical protein